MQVDLKRPCKIRVGLFDVCSPGQPLLAFLPADAAQLRLQVLARLAAPGQDASPAAVVCTAGLQVGGKRLWWQRG